MGVDAYLEIDGERITSAGSRLAIPAGARVIELGSATILPGLIDAHTHLLEDEDVRLEHSRMDMLFPIIRMGTTRRALRGARVAREYLSAGFTAVRDLGNAGRGGDTALRDAIRDGWVDGPTMLVSTRSLSGLRGQFPPLPDEQNALVSQEYAPIEDAPSAIRAVRHAVAEGADVIKVILSPSFAKEDLSAIMAESHRLKRKVAAHATSEYEVLLVAECGVDSIEHGTQGVSPEAIRLMAANRITFVPTVQSRNLAQRLYIDAMGISGEAAKVEEADNDKWLASMHDVIQRVNKVGVQIVLGSDVYHQVPGMTRGEDALEALFGLSEAGLRPTEALRAATSAAAEAIGRGDSMGQIKAGFLANLVAVDGNPLEDIHTLRRIKKVMKQGKLHGGGLLDH